MNKAFKNLLSDAISIIVIIVISSVIASYVSRYINKEDRVDARQDLLKATVKLSSLNYQIEIVKYAKKHKTYSPQLSKTLDSIRQVSDRNASETSDRIVSDVIN